MAPIWMLTNGSLQTQLDLMTHARTHRCAVECLVMLIAAFVILAVAVLLGSVLAVLHSQREGSTPPWALAALHGLLAIGGLSCLALALRGPPRGLDNGVASFGIIATLLITLAALIGVALLAKRIFKTRIAGIIIGIHATFAVSGFVILTAYVLLG
jgi:hypothetical protein